MLRPKAAALSYDSKRDNAPKILASGQGAVAEKIIAKAKEFDIPLFQNSELVELLVKEDSGSEIDPALFQAVAEVFVWLMRSEESAELSKR